MFSRYDVALGVWIIAGGQLAISSSSGADAPAPVPIACRQDLPSGGQEGWPDVATGSATAQASGATGGGAHLSGPTTLPSI